jgi:hypothetical protein
MAPASSGAFSAVCDTCLALVEMLCFRLLGFGISAMGLVWAQPGMQQAWYHAQLEGVSSVHLPDLKRMLERTVDGQPPRPHSAATS